ncbi:MAG TPA: NAD(P)H-dependent oxidoreductase [Acidimicrobiia bacterium]|nr:NAD(P)H-dependent oxidoreductase [Acidimicrobiia bacterium]
MPGPIRVLAISGSLSSVSYNTAALRAAVQLAPEDMEIEVVTLHGIPNFDAGLERDEGAPAAVQRLKTAIAAADALLIATPEYNRSIPGVLKNALDWASRGGSESPLRGKPAAILGAGARFGTLTAQAHLRQILQYGHVRVIPQPEVMIDRAETRFDDARSLTDQRSRDQIRRLLEALREEVRRGG